MNKLPQNSIVLIHDADPISYSISHELKKWNDDINLCNSLINDYMTNLLSKVGCTHYIGFLGGKGNFRYQVAKTKPYKGNRGEKNERDENWKQYINEFLVQHWGLVKVDGIESDDACSIVANQLEVSNINYLLASNDKDLDQITGNHCKFDISGPTRFYHIDKYDAATNLAYQLIIGDATDNIPGLPGKGNVFANKVIASLFDIDDLAPTITNLYSEYGNDYFQEQLALIGLLTEVDNKYSKLVLDYHLIDQQKLKDYTSKSDELRISSIF